MFVCHIYFVILSLDKRITIMKKFAFSLISCLIALCSFAQSDYAPQLTQSTISNKDAKFLLFPTENINIFLKLDTSNGEIWMVQIGLGDKDAIEVKFPTWCYPIVTEAEKSNGRFMLYPTQNIYNFVLVDQIDGRVWQAQWSFDKNKRGVIRIR